MPGEMHDALHGLRQFRQPHIVQIPAHECGAPADMCHRVFGTMAFFGIANAPQIADVVKQRGNGAAEASVVSI